MSESANGSRWIARAGVRTFMALHGVLLSVARRLGAAPRPLAANGLEVLLTGTFHSANWIRSHVAPLSRTERCARVRMVASSPVPEMSKVEAVYPPPWLRRCLGAVPARLLTFTWTALRTRPDLVGGFHLLVNGLLAGLLARMTGARSIYFCVGGPAEVAGGGLAGDNRLFGRMGAPDRFVERQLLRAVSRFDLIVAVGTDAESFFRARGVETPIHVVPGGIDAQRFAPGGAELATDVILVGRLAPVKRVDLFLRAVEAARRRLPGISATVIGDGPLRNELEALARELGIAGCVSFAGQQAQVEAWLRRARVFVLTSESEGLSLALMEAMACGLPAVVPRVGGLPDLVDEGVTGYLVAERSPEAFASRIVEILSDETRRKGFAEAARAAALRFEVDAVARRWDDILGGLGECRS